MTTLRASLFAFSAVAILVACSSSTPTVGQPCTSASSCYPDVDAAALQGTATCLTSISGGYCTHTCASDADCCAVSGECQQGYKEICAPFESTGQTYCFLSCESADITASGSSTTDPNAYCQQYAGSAFSCRSTGGGANNKQFCG
jgi:hypothetical protein